MYLKYVTSYLILILKQFKWHLYWRYGWIFDGYQHTCKRRGTIQNSWCCVLNYRICSNFFSVYNFISLCTHTKEILSAKNDLLFYVFLWFMFPVEFALGSFRNCLLCGDIIGIHFLCIRFEEQNLRLIKSQEFTIFEKQNDV